MDFAEYGDRFASIGPKAIIFENGGTIYMFDLASELTECVPAVIADDQLNKASEG
jgi:tricorn protease-like protein